MAQAVFPGLVCRLDVVSAPLSAADRAAVSSTGTIPRIDTLEGGDCLISFSSQRGRQNATGHFDAGSLTIEFDNRSGWLDPQNASGPFYPNLGVGNHIYLFYDIGFGEGALWSGYVTSFTPQYDFIAGERMILTAADLFTYLALQTWPLRTTLAPVTADVLIADILSDCGFATTWLTGGTLHTGHSLCQAPLDDPTNPGQTANALEVMQAAAEDTEAGLLFVDALGRLNFYNRYTRALQGGGTGFTLSDDGTGSYEYEEGIALLTDDTLIVNGMTVTDSTGQISSYSDAPSIAKVGPRFNTLLTIGASPNEGFDHAVFNVLQQKDSHPRIDQVTVRPVLTSLVGWTDILNVDDFGQDSVTVIRHTPSGNVISQDSFIERIEHSYDGEEWVTTIGLSNRTIGGTSQWLVLDDAALGKLGTGTLGF